MQVDKAAAAGLDRATALEGAMLSTTGMRSSTPAIAAQGPLGWLGLFIGWMIPGAGFLIWGRWVRGLTCFFLIHLTFGLGLVLHSGVAWPSWSFRSEEFNLINNFTFIVQMGTGLPALASFLASQWVQEPGAGLAWLAGAPKHPHYELGSYFLIVAGALNYFVVGNFYDRLVRPRPPFTAQERPEGAPSA